MTIISVSPCCVGQILLHHPFKLCLDVYFICQMWSVQIRQINVSLALSVVQFRMYDVPAHIQLHAQATFVVQTMMPQATLVVQTIMPQATL